MSHLATRAEVVDLKGEMAFQNAELKPVLSQLVTRTEFADLKVEHAEPKGAMKQLPTTWVMLTGIRGGQVAMAMMIGAVVFGVLRHAVQS